MKKSSRGKLKRNRGETLAETMASLLVIALAMIMLPQAILSAARMNQKSGMQTFYGGMNTDGEFHTGILTEEEKEKQARLIRACPAGNSLSIRLEGSLEGGSETLPVTVYEDLGRKADTEEGEKLFGPEYRIRPMYFYLTSPETGRVTGDLE